jgi:lysophospholipase L1-like esterase
MIFSEIKDKRSWVAAFVFFVCGLLILELILRVFVYRSNKYGVYNPDLEQYQVAAGTYNFHASEGYGNTFYVAPDEIDTPYKTGTSVIVIGDSYTEGFQVNDDEKYVSIAEQQLNEHGIEADLHNFGKSGQTIADHIWLIKYVFRQYKPKIVVLQLSINDFILGDGKKTPVNYFIQLSNGSIQFNHKPAAIRPQYELLGFLNRNFSIFGYGYTRYLKYESTFLDKNSVSQNQKNTLDENPGLENEETILKKINILKQEIGEAKLVILLTPTFPTIENGEIILNNKQYDELVALFRNTPDLEVIDPSSFFLNSFNRNQCPTGSNISSPCKGHWNKDGHEIVGRLLADELEKIMK